MTRIDHQHLEPAGFVRLNHPFGIFLDPKKYAPIASFTDEASALLKLGLIVENFVSVYIINIREEGTEQYVKDSRYFMPKLETAVALGLPVVIAEALKFINKLRNSFAHNLDYQMTEQDMVQLEQNIVAIRIEDTNIAQYFNPQSIAPIFEQGVDSLMFMRNAEYAISNRQRGIMRMVGLIYILSNKCAFYTINQLALKGRLSVDRHS